MPALATLVRLPAALSALLGELVPYSQEAEPELSGFMSPVAAPWPESGLREETSEVLRAWPSDSGDLKQCGYWCTWAGEDVSCSLDGLFPCQENPEKNWSCAVPCSQYQASFAPQTQHSCACSAFGKAECFANQCVECPDRCLPPPLDKMRTPLGTKLLCCAAGLAEGKCDPCCSHEHGLESWVKRHGVGTCCALECPCADPGSDCPS